MHHGGTKPGIERLVETCVNAFQIPENTEHYAPRDFERAKRQFVRYCLQVGFGPRNGGLNQ